MTSPPSLTASSERSSAPPRWLARYRSSSSFAALRLEIDADEGARESYAYSLGAPPRQC